MWGKTGSKTAQHRLPTNLEKYTQCRSKKTDAKGNNFSLVSSFLPISNLNSCWPLLILKPSGAKCGFLTSNCFTSTLPAASTLVSTHSANDLEGHTPVGQQPLREQTGLSGLFWNWTKAPNLQNSFQRRQLNSNSLKSWNYCNSILKVTHCRREKYWFLIFLPF